MGHERRASAWLRLHQPRSSIPKHPEPPSTSTTPNTIHFTPPPAVEELPPYSPPHVDQTPQLSRAQESAQLQTLFTKHPWRRAWGPQPTTFAAALNKAALLGHHRLILALFDLGVSVRGNQHQAIQTTTPVHEALRGPEPWLAQAFIGRLCSAGGDALELLHSRDGAGCTPLHIAAEAGEAEIARGFVVFHGADVDAVDKFGRTPLHMAARYGRAETMDVLLGCGADPGKVSEKLWMWTEGDKRRAEALGSWTVVGRNVREAVERYREMWGDDLEGGREVTEEGKEVDEKKDGKGLLFERENLPPLVAAAGPSRPRQEVQPQMPQVMRPRLHQGPLHGDREAEKLAMAFGQNEVEAAQRVLQHLARVATMQRSVPTTLFTPEYQEWKNDCQTLLAESRKQKEKNRRETGNEMDLY
ncbi:ankyrin repeat-containing domain protein [Podospora aff. communis PSN243]|uniref:Ankyrin repeat-containing domain protein n=1 Tax=Podospora aff. communis PSN243 TaxID=3040156 RepID=A0AAV9GED6_9PEZI|nr:ankyrin repeat-containing domain protein [Podospora aff. communis PSN243]